jgi:phosphoribosylaminoimidazole carboxylase (NCAIR synthetase)
VNAVRFYQPSRAQRNRSSDRLKEKSFFREISALAPFRASKPREELDAAVRDRASCHSQNIANSGYDAKGNSFPQKPRATSNSVQNSARAFNP